MEKNLKCVWELGTPCDGEVKERKMFGQIDVPVCESHLNEHKEIMLLFRNGHDIEEILQATPEWRKEQALLIRLSKIDEKEDDI